MKSYDLLPHSDGYGEINSTGLHDLPKKSLSLAELRKNRHKPTPHAKKIPGFDISELTSERLEFLLSLNLDSNPLTKNWKIKAAHELATRYIDGDASAKKHKAPPDETKAYGFAEKEINSYTIDELESKFFQISVAGKNINIAKNWKQKRNSYAQLLNDKAIDDYIAQSKWNGALREELKRNSNAILLAWEKQLIAARLAEYYKKRKKETRDIEDAIAAKFYKRLVRYLRVHEKPKAAATTGLKKVSPRFNQLRLLAARVLKLFSQLPGKSIPQPLRWAMTAAGLYFLIELLADIIIILIDGRQAFWEDNRPSRMANAAIWFGINFTCFILTLSMLGMIALPIAPAVALLWIAGLTIAGCVFDVGLEVAIWGYSYKTQQQNLDTIETELAKLSDVDEKQLFDDEDKQNDTAYTDARNHCEQKVALIKMRDEILLKRKELLINRVYTIAIMCVMVACAALIFFPPAAIPLMPIIAASVALVVGSVLGGIGKYLFWNTIMDAPFRTSVANLLDKFGRKIKEFFVGKEKTPFNGPNGELICGHSLNTCDINKGITSIDNQATSLIATPTHSPHPVVGTDSTTHFDSKNNKLFAADNIIITDEPSDESPDESDTSVSKLPEPEASSLTF